MALENISIEKKDRVGWVSEVCVVAVTAAGDKAFSTWVDMRDHMPDRFHEMLETFRGYYRNTDG